MVSEPTPRFRAGTDRPASIPPLSRGGTRPINRVDFYRVRHQLSVRLIPYQVTRTPSFLREASWDTLRYWAEQ